MSYKPADFNQPLIRALGRLSNFQTSSCYLPDVYSEIMSIMDIESLESFGMIANGKQTKVASWIGYAFDNVRRAGHATLVRRKRWALTDEGVEEAKRLCGVTDNTVPESSQEPPQDPPQQDLGLEQPPATPQIPATSTPAPETTPAPSGLQQVEATPQENAGPIEVASPATEPEKDALPDYMNDPAIKESVISATKCFGYEVEDHDLCGKCYLRPECRTKKYELLVEVARKVAHKEREEEAQRQREAEEEERLKKQKAAESFIEDLPTEEVAGSNQDTLTSVSVPANPKEILVPADSLCVKCGGRIPKDDKAMWIMDVGLYHHGCVE